MLRAGAGGEGARSLASFMQNMTTIPRLGACDQNPAAIWGQIRAGALACAHAMTGSAIVLGLTALLPAAAPSRLLGSSTVLMDGPRRVSREYSASWER